MKFNKIFKCVICLSMSVLLLLAGCSAGGGKSQPGPAGEIASGNGDGDKLIIAINDEIEGTDVQQVGWTNLVHRLLFQPLITYDMELESLVPAAAQDYEISDDGLQITFNLDPESKFSNGNVMNAESIKSSLERYIRLSQYASDIEAVDEIIVKDEYTLVLKLKAPAAYMIPCLAETFLGVIDTTAADSVSDDEFNRKSVGNGPYKVEEWVQGSHITLSKNEYYKTFNPNVDNKGPLNFDEITIRFIPEGFTRLSELESGNVDLISTVPVESVADLQKNSGVTVSSYKSPGVRYISINTNNETLKDINVRKAIAHAIDRSQVTKVLNDTVTPVSGFMSEAQICYDPSAEEKFASQYNYNVESAKELLKEAGWEDTDSDGIADKDGIPLKLTLLVALDNNVTKQSAPILQAQLKSIGIDLELREYEAKYIKQMRRDGTFDLAMSNYEWIDPDIFTYLFTEESGYGWWDPEFTRIIGEARYNLDTNGRTQQYADAQQILLGKVPAIGLFAENIYIGYKNNLKNIKMSKNGTIYFNDAVKE